MLCGPLSCYGKFANPQQKLGHLPRSAMVDSLGWRKASKERGAIHSAFAGFVWRRATSRGPSHHLYADRAFILAAVQRNALILRYASRELRADREVVLTALQQDASCIRYVSKELRADYEVVMAAVKKGNLSKEGWHPFQFASVELEGERWIVLEAVQQDASYLKILKYVSKEVLADREVILAAVKKDARALKFASVELKSDREIVLAAVQQDASRLKPDPKYASAALRAVASVELHADREIVLAAVQQDASHLKFASAALRADRAVVLAAVKKSGFAFQYASVELRADPYVIQAAMQMNEPVDPYQSYAVQVARDRDALGAAVGARAIPAPHAAMNGAPEALAIVHCLLSSYVEAISSVIVDRTTSRSNKSWSKLGFERDIFDLWGVPVVGPMPTYTPSKRPRYSYTYDAFWWSIRRIQVGVRG